MKCSEKSCKLVIDSGSERNVISRLGVARLGLKTEPLLKPFKVAWVDNTSLPITQQCHMPFHLGDYKEDIFCVVIPMDVSHILLGCPWLYDNDVTSYGQENDVTSHGQENTHVFKHKGKIILLHPTKPEPKGKDPTSTKRATPKCHNLHLLIEKEFVQESEEVNIILAIVSKVVSPSIVVVKNLPKEVSHLLDEFKDVTPIKLPPDLPPMRDI